VSSDPTPTGGEIKVYDPSRRPRDWNLLLDASQCAAFFRREGTQIPLSSEGVPFDNFRDSTFLLFDSLEAARTFCEAQVQRHPDLCCEIFDHTGRASPPLLTILHPDVAAKDESSAHTAMTRKLLALALILAAVPLFWWDWHTGGWLGFPTFIGFSLLLAALRLFQMNVGRKEVLVEQQRRVEAHLQREKARDQGAP
jgi:hypothetical protein